MLLEIKFSVFLFLAESYLIYRLFFLIIVQPVHLFSIIDYVLNELSRNPLPWEA